jgi:hypothetical protein
VRDYNREVDLVNQHNRREADRVNQHNKWVVEDHNRRVRQNNQNAAAAVNKYNSAVRAHNAQVERDRQRRISALRSISSTNYVEVRQSTFDLSERFDSVERSAGTASYADLLALSEREASNSATVAEALVADEPKAPESAQDTGILEYLAGFSQDLCDRWRGALFSLNPVNPDAGRHFCTSVREIFTEILDKWADNNDVRESNPNCELTPNGTPSRRAKIRFLLNRNGADSPEMLGFVEKTLTILFSSSTSSTRPLTAPLANMVSLGFKASASASKAVSRFWPRSLSNQPSRPARVALNLRQPRDTIP